ncbi:MAG: DUF541 domain-containing protein [Halomonadaceae bacterium]|nr:MAG: DUF541 domain-containing protein [Halomonadaceae bacterium]
MPAMQQAVDSEIRAALELAEALGIPQEAVEASRIDVQPQWQWRPEQKLVGHQVSREIRFRAEGIEQYAQLLSELTQLGFSQLNQAGREPEDPQGLQDQALERAMGDATRKARVLAQAAGRSLGDVVVIEEESAQRYQPQMMMRTASDSSESSAYSPGEITLEARIQVVFQLQ